MAKRERPGLLAMSDEIFMLMSRDDAKNNWKFEFAAAFIPVSRAGNQTETKKPTKKGFKKSNYDFF